MNVYIQVIITLLVYCTQDYKYIDNIEWFEKPLAEQRIIDEYLSSTLNPIDVGTIATKYTFVLMVCLCSKNDSIVLILLPFQYKCSYCIHICYTFFGINLFFRDS